MTGPGGLSLRVRLLLLQIAVTAFFLLVMGLVSTAVVDRSLASQFSNQVLAYSTWSPAQIQANPPPQLAAVYVTFAPFTVTPLTPGEPATSVLVSAVSELSPARVRVIGNSGGPFPVGAHFQAAARALTAAQSYAQRPSVLIVAERDTAVRAHLRSLILAEMITGGVLLLLLALGGQWLIGRGLSPLDRMARTANDITARGDLNERMAASDQRTEVGRLGIAINTMLDRIQQAFGARLSSERKVREFAADASHELRTPLTTIRGYAELYRQGALGPDQLPGAMRRIEQEAQRMSALVSELLELARLDRTSSLDLAETDLAMIVSDMVADALAVEPDRVITAQAPPHLIAVVDERRIRQVLANLLGNVRAHTPVTAAVTVRLGQIQGGYLVEVTDAGPGMSPEDTARAFDRFHRATDRPDPGDGTPADETRTSGSGLGLSIVQAIATAHGGQATLESWPARGTRVRIWLPDRPPAGPPDAPPT